MLTNQTGTIIRTLRLEQQLTQKQLADKLHISDKTVSKWERGLGLPDVALIPALAELLQADIQKLLRGEAAPNDFVGGNMKNTLIRLPHLHQHFALHRAGDRGLLRQNADGAAAHQSGGSRQTDC